MKTIHSLVAVVCGAVFAALIALAPSVAQAGGCTPCTTSAECVTALGDAAFCIVWTDGTTACPGSAMPARGCCPGQGCATFTGRPSCEIEGRCTVVDGLDAGAPRPDAGGPPRDAGPGSDAGPGFDAGPRIDAGAGTGTRRDDGCGCHVGGPVNTRLGLFGFALVALALVVQRRSRGV